MIRKRSIPLLALFLLLTSSIPSGEKEPVLFLPDLSDIRLLKNSIPPLSFNPQEYSAPVQDYFEYYGLNFPGVEHRFGFFSSYNRKIAAHIFLPETPRGTVFLLHGYLDHSALNTPLITRLLEKQYAVATFDLPGHGLSEGASADIDDFHEYAITLFDFVESCRGQVPEGYIAMGHSTGCSTIIEYLFHIDNSFEFCIFSAPLIRSYLWNLSKVGVGIGSIFTDRVSRRFSGASSDREYIRFIKEDPLQCQSVPVNWIRSLFKWNDCIKTYPENETPVIILQGLDDTVVDYHYNFKYLQDRFPQMKIHMIEEARHNLFNERREIREEVFSLIADCL